ncbi:MAG: DALR anticodon-binding domain-containing protein [Actinomycetota bacterium]
MTANQLDLSAASIYCLLLHQLQAVIGNESEAIPLQKTKEHQGALYLSAIALKLSPIWQQPAMDIAVQLAAVCQKVIAIPPVPSVRGITQNLPQSLESFTVEVVPPGMILFELTDVGLATWLQHLIETPFQVGSDVSPKTVNQNLLVWSPVCLPPSDRLFPIQYSHARCCSLLRLAHRDRLLTLAEPQISPSVGQLVVPNPIPWLEPNGKLRLVQPTERHLMSQLLTALDALALQSLGEGRDRTSKVVNWLKLTNDLSQAFQAFYSQCRIWGEVKIQQPELAQARLGLVLATQSLIKVLLEEVLGAIAPLEL